MFYFARCLTKKPSLEMLLQKDKYEESGCPDRNQIISCSHFLIKKFGALLQMKWQYMVKPEKVLFAYLSLPAGKVQPVFAKATMSYLKIYYETDEGGYFEEYDYQDITDDHWDR